MEVLTEALGEEEAARLWAEIDSLVKATTSLWAPEPPLSEVVGKG